MSERAWQLVVVPHTHWDREWYLTHEQFRARLVTLVDELLDLLETDPGFRHFLLDGQTIVLDDYLEVRPQARARIEALVRAGRIAVGPWYVLPDEWLVSGEALLRNLRLGLRKAASFGGGMRVGYVPDQFGHVGQLPQLFALFGFSGAALWRGVGADVTQTPFVWEAPDGSRVTTLYLPHGYGHGAHLPLAPHALARRLEREIAKHASYCRDGAMLFMNGVDHALPQRGLPEALAKAVALLPGVTAQIGTLEQALDRAAATRSDDRPVHRGELRSGLRSPLLPGCASTRIGQKQRDFRNDRLLTRYLEPLSAWLAGLGGRADPGLLDFLWQLALENHPHDSICGCSVDRVHAQMETRFDRVEELASAELARVGRELAERLAPPPGVGSRGAGDAIVVWNPHGGGRAEVDAELELLLPRGPHRRGARVALHLRDETARRLPAVAEVREPGLRWSGTFPKSLGLALLPDMSREFLGWFVNVARWCVDPADASCLALDVRLGALADRALDLEATRSALVEALTQPGIERIHVTATRPPRVRLRFVDTLPGHGLRVYRAFAGRAGRAAPTAPPRAERSGRDGERRIAIENDHYRVEADAAGRLAILHRASATRVEDALRLVDEGDRGDEYDFDPVPDAAPVEALERVRVRLDAASEAEAAITIDAQLRVPEGLAGDRRARGARTVALPVRMRVRLAPGLDRVDTDVEVDNRARDHRLRLHVRAPFRATRHEVESAFEIAGRPIDPAPGDFGSPRPAELPSGASPQRTFASIDDGLRALTVANRGSPEVEAVRERDGSTSLAVTLLRAVGWLSRADLRSRPLPAGPLFETPDAQVPGRQRAELSLRFHAADDTARALEAHRFASPPIAFPHGGTEARGRRLADGARIVEIEDPQVVVSGLSPRHGGGVELRVVNLSPRARQVDLALVGLGSPPLRMVALAHQRPDGRLEGVENAAPVGPGVRLRPWQILTVCGAPS